MNKINYHKELLNLIEKNKAEGVMPSLLLHSCCAPCSSYCIKFLSEFFKVTILYYNPNISPFEEYEKRKAEQKRLVLEMKTENKVEIMDCDYNYNDFLRVIKGFEKCSEGGERCFKCYRLRLEKTALLSVENNFDYFCTTLSISPLKNAQKINEIGNEIAKNTGGKFLPSDFKKNEGYKQSIELSKQYNLYRQDYCGCVFSKRGEK